MLDRHFLYLTGLPCSGLGFLSQLLAQHPHIYSDNLRSPLCDFLVNFRSFITTNPLAASRLQQDLNPTMERSRLGMQGFINGWYGQIAQPWIIDIHPQWLQHLELIHLLDPNCRMVVCVREVGQICAAIENQHQQTLLLDFPEQLANLSRAERAQKLFAPQGAIGSLLKSLEQLQDLEDSLQKRIFYVVYEHLVSDPEEVLTELLKWIELSPISPDLTQVSGSAPNYAESAGKYVEEPYNPQKPLVYYTLPKRFEITIQQNFPWFYQLFYPGRL